MPILTPPQKLQILRDIETNVALAYTRAIDILNSTFEKITLEKTKEIEKKFDEVSNEMRDKIIPMRPEDGYTPKKYIDYFTKKEINEMVSIIAKMAKPEKGKDYMTGEDKDEMAKTVASWLAKKLPQDGVDFISPSAVKELCQELFSGMIGGKEKKFIDAISKALEKALIPQEVATKLNTLEEKVDMKVIKGLSNLITALRLSIKDVGGRVRDSKAKGGGGSGNRQHETKNLTSSTITVTTIYNIAGGGFDILCFYQGQQVQRGVGYTVSGKTITLLFTPVDSTFLDIVYTRT